MKQLNIDMTHGRIIPKLMAFAIPLLLTSVLQQLYSLTDAVIVRYLTGVEAFAAVGADGSLLWIAESMLMGLAQGFGVIFSQQFGALRHADLSGSYRCGLLLSAIMSVILCILMACLCDSLLAIINTPTAMLQPAKLYLISMLPFILAAALYNTSAAWLRAVGDSRTPLIAMLISSLFNIGMDYILIVPCRLGIAGAGLATGMAQFIACLICLRVIRRQLQRVNGWHEHASALMRMGLPSMLRNGIIASGGGIVQQLVNSYGVAMAAGVAASKKYFTLLQLCGNALEAGAATFAGQNMGSGNTARIKEGLRRMILLGIVSSALTDVLAYSFTRPLIGLVLGQGETDAFNCGVAALRWAAAFLPALYLLCIIRAFLQGIGHAALSMISGFCELVTRIAVCMFLPALIGQTSAYIAEEIGWVVTFAYLGICMWIVLRRQNRRGTGVKI